MSNLTSTKQIIFTVLKWIFVFIFFFFALGSLTDRAFLSSIIFLLIAVLLIPPLTEFWRTKIRFLNNVLIKGGLLFIMFIIGIIVNPSISKKSSKKNEITTENNPQKEEINKIETPNYEISKEATIRVDGAISYFVLIDKVDLSNDRFMKDIKVIVDKIVKEKGAKINVEILDNREALELLYKSHYGINALGRILNDAELNLLKKHLIASFTGELDEMLYFNQLDYFPSSSKNKFNTSIEYNPK